MIPFLGTDVTKDKNNPVQNGKDFLVEAPSEEAAASLKEVNKEDIIALLNDKNVPGDELTYNDLANEILSNPPKQGYLTISNALQWRLQYKRVIGLDNAVVGIVNYVW